MASDRLGVNELAQRCYLTLLENALISTVTLNIIEDSNQQPARAAIRLAEPPARHRESLRSIFASEPTAYRGFSRHQRLIREGRSGRPVTQ
jgi:hypothetical protein